MGWQMNNYERVGALDGNDDMCPRLNSRAEPQASNPAALNPFRPSEVRNLVCYKCRGQGEVKSHWGPSPCPACDGTGRIVLRQPQPNDKLSDGGSKTL